MDGAKRGSSIVPSLPPPSPKSPPDYPDLYGKRRELAIVQTLHREIGFLELPKKEELKSVGCIQTASRSCKEVADFVMANSDPLITTSCKIRRSGRIWRWLCGKSCFNLSWICCCCGCCPYYRQSECAEPKCPSCLSSCWRCSCLQGSCSNCCDCDCPSCPDCLCSCARSCSKCTCCWQPRCLKVPQCSCIKKNCCSCF